MASVMDVRMCRWAAVVAAVASMMSLVGALAQSGGEGDGSGMKRIIDGLKSDVSDERENAAKALDELGKKGLSQEEGLLALRAAVDKFPPREREWKESAADLVWAVEKQPREAYIPVVLELFPKYTSRAKTAALSLLSKTESRSAANAYMTVLRAYARTGTIEWFPLAGFGGNPRDADVLFPELLDYASIEGLEWDVYATCLQYFQSGLLATEQMLPQAKRVLASYQPRAVKLFPAQQEDGVAWMWEDEYQKSRNIAGLLLDLMGYFPEQEVETALRNALRYSDPHLKCYALLSLVRLGKSVTKRDVLEVARSAEMRNCLYSGLGGLDRLDLYPEEFRTQEAFAESTMVTWLAYPTELARAPDEIELMAVFESVPQEGEQEEEAIEYYVFRFRVRPEGSDAEGSWMAGVAGPFLKKEKPSTRSYGGTFSKFTSWDGKTAREHLEDILGVLEKWVEYHDSQ